MAHYWTGGISAPRPVKEIGLYGAAIAAPEVYYPGTLIRISLEDVTVAEDGGKAIQYAGLWGKVLRMMSDGFCVAFIFESRAERMHFRHFLEQACKRGLDENDGDETEKVRGAVSD
jgi:hypothetical protein